MVLDPYLYDKDKPCIVFDTTGKRSIFRDFIRLCEKRGNTSGDTYAHQVQQKTPLPKRKRVPMVFRMKQIRKTNAKQRVRIASAAPL